MRLGTECYQVIFFGEPLSVRQGLQHANPGLSPKPFGQVSLLMHIRVRGCYPQTGINTSKAPVIDFAE